MDYWKQLYNSWKPGKSWRDLWTKRAHSPLPEMPELPEKPPLPEAKLSEPINAIIAAKDAEIASLNAKLSKTTESLSRLERSFGLAPAAVVVDVPVNTEGALTLIDKFNSLPDGPEKTEFFRLHQGALSKFITSP
jgi:hypothetical protein